MSVIQVSGTEPLLPHNLQYIYQFEFGHLLQRHQYNPQLEDILAVF